MTGIQLEFKFPVTLPELKVLVRCLARENPDLSPHVAAYIRVARDFVEQGLPS